MTLFGNTLVKKNWCSNLKLVPAFRSLHITQVKYLYSPASLGIDGYLLTRKRSKEQFTNFADKFRAKMNDFASDTKNMIFSEDLKNILHLAEPTDLNLVLKMIKKFNTQQSEYRFGSFVFGPVVMRMFHFLDAPKDALECFNDPKNDGFFDQIISFHILLDLLYCHEMYDEMYKVFDKIQEKQINMTKFPKYCVVMVLAACYKQNSPQSLEYASKLWTEMTQVGTVPLRRACTYFAALALKQGAPQRALESISTQRQHYVTIRNIKVMALADMDRVEDALPILRTVLDVDRPDQTDKHTFFEEAVERVRLAVVKSDNKDVKKEFEDVHKALRDRGLIENKTLDQLLNAEIQKPNKLDQNRINSSFPKKRMPFVQRQMSPKRIV